MVASAPARCRWPGLWVPAVALQTLRAMVVASFTPRSTEDAGHHRDSSENAHQYLDTQNVCLIFITYDLNSSKEASLCPWKSSIRRHFCLCDKSECSARTQAPFLEGALRFFFLCLRFSGLALGKPFLHVLVTRRRISLQPTREHCEVYGGRGVGTSGPDAGSGCDVGAPLSCGFGSRCGGVCPDSGLRDVDLTSTENSPMLLGLRNRKLASQCVTPRVF